MANKSKKKVSNIMLVLICVMIILYTAADFALQYFAGIEVSPTLTTAWFAFWSVEIVALAAIKTQVANDLKSAKNAYEQAQGALHLAGTITAAGYAEKYEALQAAK